MRKIQGNKCASLAPWADTTAKQNLWVCHSNWAPRCKSYFCKNLKMFGVYSVVEKRVCLQISGIWGIVLSWWWSVVPRASCFLCGKMLTDIQIIRSVNTQASGRPFWCLVRSWPFVLLAENEDQPWDQQTTVKMACPCCRIKVETETGKGKYHIC